jgi:hypothetical protein
MMRKYYDRDQMKHIASAPQDGGACEMCFVDVGIRFGYYGNGGKSNQLSLYCKACLRKALTDIYNDVCSRCYHFKDCRVSVKGMWYCDRCEREMRQERYFKLQGYYPGVFDTPRIPAMRAEDV